MAQQKTKRPLPSSSVATALRRYRWIPSPAERPRKFPTENLMMGPQSSEGVQLPNISVAEIYAYGRYNYNELVTIVNVDFMEK